MELYTAAQVREADRRAIEERGIPSLELMEHAARAVAEAVWELLQPEEDGPAGHGFHSVILMSKKGAPEITGGAGWPPPACCWGRAGG